MIIRGEIILGLFILVIILACIVGVLICWEKNKNDVDLYIMTSQQIENEGVFRYLKIICKQYYYVRVVKILPPFKKLTKNTKKT